MEISKLPLPFGFYYPNGREISKQEALQHIQDMVENRGGIPLYCQGAPYFNDIAIGFFTDVTGYEPCLSFNQGIYKMFPTLEQVLEALDKFGGKFYLGKFIEAFRDDVSRYIED